MGSNPHVHLGPYLEVHVRQVTSTDDWCQAKNCPNPQVGFCPTCGIKASERFRTVKRDNPNLRVILDERPIRQALCVLGHDKDEAPEIVSIRVFPNEDRCAPREFGWDLHSSDDILLLIEGAQIEKEKEWFRTAFAAEITHLEARGFVSLELRWGLVTYWM